VDCSDVIELTMKPCSHGVQIFNANKEWAKIFESVNMSCQGYLRSVYFDWCNSTLNNCQA